MACVGRTKECTIVPSNHFGPIPGIPVGTMWRFRVQVPADVGPRPSRSPSTGEGYPKGRRLGIHARSFPGVARTRSLGCRGSHNRSDAFSGRVRRWLQRRERRGPSSRGWSRRCHLFLGGVHRSASLGSIDLMWQASTAGAMMGRTPWSWLEGMRTMW